MSDWLPSLNALRAFEAVARHLSYRDAAAELHVTPAAVKQLVGKLEAALGAALVERRGRGIALTRAGAEGAPGLRAAFKQMTDAVERMRAGGRRHPLTITVEPSFAAAWLVPRLDGFKAANPEIDVLIDSAMRIVDLEREAVDIGIRYAMGPGGALIRHRLFDDETLAVCSPRLAAGPPALTTLGDLERVTLIHMEFGHMAWVKVASHWFDWENWLAAVGAAGIASGHGIRFNDYNLAVQASIAGQGMVLGSLPMVRDALAAGLLVAPFAERARTGAGYDLVTTKEAMARPEVDRFVAWILAAVEAAAGPGQNTGASAILGTGPRHQAGQRGETP